MHLTTPSQRSAFGLEDDDWVARSSLYQEYLAEREEILRHKWLESEKAGRDVGFESALISWVVHHRAQWRRERRQSLQAEGPPRSGPL
jgi:hypothetical protein